MIALKIEPVVASCKIGLPLKVNLPPVYAKNMSGIGGLEIPVLVAVLFLEENTLVIDTVRC